MVDFLIQPIALRDTLFQIKKNLESLIIDSQGNTANINQIFVTLEDIQTNGVRFGVVTDSITQATGPQNPGSGTIQLYNRLDPLVIDPGNVPAYNRYETTSYAAGETVAVINYAGSWFVIFGAQ